MPKKLFPILGDNSYLALTLILRQKTPETCQKQHHHD